MDTPNEHKIKKGLFYGLLLFLVLPLFIVFSGIRLPTKELKGSFYSASDISISAKAWFDGNYQNQKDDYLKQNYGLTNFYVRLSNELDFLFFKKAKARFVVVGKENYLFEQAYVDAYYGHDFIGLTKIRNVSIKLKNIQTELAKEQKLLITVLAPGKASFFPEYIPERLKTDSSESNYLGFVNELKKEGLPFIDFNKFFSDKKKTSKYPLYPQFGIHWSNYASMLAFDSLVSYIENKTNTALPKRQLLSFKVSDSLEAPDNDILEGMNLLWPLKSFKMAYPTFDVIKESSRPKKLNVLVVSDSFWWHIYDSGLPGKVFEENRFWYYNEEMYPESFKETMLVSQCNYYENIRKADVIIILHSESTLFKFGNGFVDMCYEVICKPNKQKEELQKAKWSIRASPDWFKAIKLKANTYKVSVDSMLTLDALYMIEQSKNK